MEPSYQISAGKIAHQNIDGEIIVIHFDTGDYYSLTGTAVDLWQMLATPQSLENIRARFANWDAKSETSVRQFIRVLVGEGLIEATEAPAATAAVPPAIPFGDPVVEKYSDMQTILLADPIHDVDEAGWPKVKPQD
jgi:hypothetical protein